MNVNPISFRGFYNTREVAEIVSGKQLADTKFLSSVSGIPVEKFRSSYPSDLLVLSSSYCGKKIADAVPSLRNLRELSDKIRKAMLYSLSDKSYLKDVKSLISERDEAIEIFCQQHDETISIPDFDIPFFNK